MPTGNGAAARSCFRDARTRSTSLSFCIGVSAAVVLRGTIPWASL